MFSGVGGVVVLLGGGVDRLNEGEGVASLSGGLGNDVFAFASRAELGNVITDLLNASSVGR